MFVATVVGMVSATLPTTSGAESCLPPGGEILTQTTAGPYLLAVSVQPETPFVGTIRLMVAVCDAVAGAPIPRASVAMIPVNEEGAQGRPALAFTRGGRPEQYGADLMVKEPGHWRYRVRVSADAGEAETEVSVEVRGPPDRADLGPGAVFFGVLGAIGAGVAYLVLQAQRGSHRH